MSERSIDYLLARGEWVREFEGVYRLPGAPPSWHQALTAACLWAGEGAVVSHRAAGALLRLDGVPPGVVEVTATKQRKSPRDGVCVNCTGTLPACDLARVGPLPVTNVSRTLIDLGAVVNEETVEVALEDALRRRLTSVSRLRWRIDQVGVQGRRGAGVLRGLLNRRERGAAPAESILEVRLLRLLADSGLPAPVKQHEIRERGRVLARVDLAYPDSLVAVEADGYRFHSGKAAWQGDRERRNLLTSRGWLVLHVTWDDLARHPEVIVADVRRALRFTDGG